MTKHYSWTSYFKIKSDVTIVTFVIENLIVAAIKSSNGRGNIANILRTSYKVANSCVIIYFPVPPDRRINQLNLTDQIQFKCKCFQFIPMTSHSSVKLTVLGSRISSMDGYGM